MTLASMADVLQTVGNTSGAAIYSAAASAGRAQLHDAYWHKSNETYGSGSVTASVLPLALNVTPQADRHAAELALLSSLDADGYHMYSGIWGWRYLPEVLTAIGRTDVALQLLA
jgi:alpha-L-rhamnosidase